jgi:hypothetical protein
LINQWEINDLLPERCNKRVLKQKLTAVKENLFKSQVNMAKRYNYNCVLQPFKVGNLIYYRNHAVSHAERQITSKLLHRWKDQFKVDRFLTTVTPNLVDPTSGSFVDKAHVSLLKPVQD